MKKYLELDMIIEQDHIVELIIAQLAEKGFYGFLEEEKHLRAYHEDVGFNDFKELLSPFDISFTHDIIEEENWNALWESSFEPVIVDEFAAIRADFHEKPENVIHDIIITPKMSFGTGHHSTTLGMIKGMKDIDFTGKKVMDFGTGTGILAILAEKCGAKSVDAIDNDDWSINNAEENIFRNKCQHINLWKADQFPEDSYYDIILANINLHVLVNNWQMLYNALQTGGLLLISGILKNDEKAIMESFSKSFFNLHNKLNINDWLIFSYSKI